jgi:hypothetical protein
MSARLCDLECGTLAPHTLSLLGVSVLCSD